MLTPLTLSQKHVRPGTLPDAEPPPGRGRGHREDGLTAQDLHRGGEEGLLSRHLQILNQVYDGHSRERPSDGWTEVDDLMRPTRRSFSTSISVLFIFFLLCNDREYNFSLTATKGFVYISRNIQIFLCFLSWCSRALVRSLYCITGANIYRYRFCQ